MYRILKRDGNAKRAEFTTVHGTVQTPVFMNVGTAAAIKGAVATSALEQIEMCIRDSGKQFCISTWGESHGKGIGVVIDGCPAGLSLSEEDIQKYLDRRRPGQSQFTTSRNEGDRAEILSGVFEGKTTGTPISILVANTSQRSQDYSEIASYYRPGHADYTFDQKYGFRDYRGGGRSSGRETIGRVAAGRCV